MIVSLPAIRASTMLANILSNTNGAPKRGCTAPFSVVYEVSDPPTTRTHCAYLPRWQTINYPAGTTEVPAG